jgi:sugar lactone lactonase YvrE
MGDLGVDAQAVPSLRARTVVTGFAYGEGPRWRDGRLWFSDTVGGRILSVGPDDDLTVEAEVPRPSGLGWLATGQLLVATLASRRDGTWIGPAQVLVGSPSNLEPVADLSGEGSFNDLVVGPDGIAYLDFYRGPAVLGEILMFTPDRQLRTAATDLAVPNGMTISQDGSRLLVSETGAERITAFAIGRDGELSGRRTFAVGIPGPDGLCLDAEDAVWVGSFNSGDFLRVREGGECTARVHVPAPRWAVAPMLGGPDRRMLYLLSNDTDHERLGMGMSSGYLEQIEVDVPGVGWP